MKKHISRTKQRLLADKKKLPIMCMLFLFAVFMWVKMFVGGQWATATSQASTPPNAPSTASPALDTLPGETAKIVTMYAPMVSILTRNIFTLDLQHDRVIQINEVDPGDPEKSHQNDADNVLEVHRKARGIGLQQLSGPTRPKR